MDHSTTIRWVLPEIKNLLHGARQILEDISEGRAEKSSLEGVGKVLQESRGVLELLQVYGASMLFEEMGQLVDRMLAGKVDQMEEALELMMRGVLQSQDYLEHAQTHSMDNPLLLMPLLNDLRAIRREPLLSENSLFDPDLNARIPELGTSVTAAGKVTSAALANYAKQLRPHYQKGLVDWFRGRDRKDGLRRMGTVLTHLERVCGNTPPGRLSWVARGCVEALLDGGLEASVSLKLLLGQVDRQIRPLVEAGADALEAPVPTELMKNLLYYLGRSNSRSKRVQQIAHLFRLEELMPNQEDFGAGRAALGPGLEVLNKVTDGIGEDLARVKDTLDIFVRSESNSPEDLEPMLETMRRVADTLGLLGLGRVRKTVLDQAREVEDIIAAGSLPSDETLMNIAAALLDVDSALEAVAARGLGDAMEAPGSENRPTEGPQLGSYERHQMLEAVVRESKTELAIVEERVTAFLGEPRGSESLSEVPVRVSQVSGALFMMGKRRAAELLSKAGRYVPEVLGDRAPELPPMEQQQSFADALVSIEYYLDALVEGRTDTDAILDFCEASISGLALPPEMMVVDEEEETVEEVSLAPEPVSSEEQEILARPELVEEGIFEGEEITLEGDDTPQLPAQVTDSMVRAQSILDRMEREGEPDTHPAEEVGPVSGRSPEEEDIPETAEPVSPVAVETRVIVDPEILEIFIEEAGEVLDTIQAQIPGWRSRLEDQEALATVRRAFHTLKGSGRLVGATLVAELAWRLERMLNRVIDGAVPLAPPMLDLVQEVHDDLPLLIDAFRQGVEPESSPQSLMDRADQLAEGAPPPSGPGDGNGGSTPPQGSESIPRSGGAASGVGGVAGKAPESAEPSLLDVFRQEAGRYLDEMNTLLGRDSMGGTATSMVTTLSRLCHTLHGAAHTAGVSSVSRLFGVLEQILVAALGQDRPLSSAARGLLRDGADFLSQALAALQQGGDPPPEDFGLLKQADDLLARSHLSAPETGQPDEGLLEVFLDEAGELLEQSEEDLNQWQGGGTPSEAVASLHRGLHTLKGGARMAGLGDIGDLAHRVEDILSRVMDGRLAADQTTAAMVQKGVDAVAGMLEAVRGGNAPIHDPGLLETLHTFAQASTDDGTGAEKAELPMDDAGPSNAGAAEDETVMHELRRVFLEEAEELLAASDALMEQWRANPEDQEPVKQLQRSLHTLKGGARMAGLNPMGDLSHGVESALTLLGDGVLVAGSALQDVVEAARDRLAQMLDEVRSGRTPEYADDLMKRLDALVSPGSGGVDVPASIPTGPPEETRPEAGPPQGGEPPRTERDERIQVRTGVLDNLVNYAGEVSIARARIEQQVGEFKYSLQEMDQTVHRLRAQLRQLEIESESQIRFRHDRQPVPGDEEFDPLELDRFTQVHQLSRGLAESVSDLESIQTLLGDLTRESETALLQQARVSSELQEGLMGTRLLPFARHLPRLRRIVRQTASELNKPVELHVSGQDEELDHGILSRSVPALEHMLRNAVDHGIESPEERRRQGKPETGRIDLTVSRDGAEAVIHLRDDGRGLNLDAIRRQAIRRGLIDEKMRVSDEDLVQFVFEQAFSTASRVTQISGRGVGLDVVATAVKQLGGSLAVETHPGRGSDFTLRLPTTLSVSQALMVRLDQEVFAVPLANIQGVVRFSGSQLRGLMAKGQHSFEHAGEHYPVMPLANLLGMEWDPGQSESQRYPALLARSGEDRMALPVDAIAARQEVVVKPVGEQLNRVRWIGGATILGDGRVALIVDVPAVIRRRAILPGRASRREEPKAETGREESAPVIMVVDDSITVRKVTQRFLERNGMEVMLAKDGVDALAILQGRQPDLMLLDVEMPHMDGYELATTIRNDRQLKGLPIIMITSRTGQKHLDRAIRIGVDRYLGKPYNEGELLGSIQELLQHGHA